MTHTNTQLKRALAKMLPNLVAVNPSKPFTWYWKNKTDTCDYKVLDTELLYLCWLVEETLTNNECRVYSEELVRICVNPKLFQIDCTAGGWFFHATWQQRVIALCKVKGVEIL